MSHRPLVLYHADCADGFAAAWCAWGVHGDAADYLPVRHGVEPPDVAGRDVFLLDFCYKADQLRRLAAFNRRLVVLDHHETALPELMEAQAKLGDRLSYAYDLRKCGARLAWEYFHPGKPAPWLIDYVEDRDLWRWRLPQSRQISAAMRSFPFDFALWGRWAGAAAAAYQTRLAGDGEAILRAQEQDVERAVGNAREVELDGCVVPALNCTHLISETAGRLARGRPFAVCWFVRGDGKVVHSLRSDEGGSNVAQIARRHGGGGHARAAGFESDRFEGVQR